MTDTLKWIYTKDHRPTFEECEGKVVVYQSNYKAILAQEITQHSEWSKIFMACPTAYRYAILSITDPDPEPVPCKVCGCKPEVDNLYGGGQINVRCMSHDDHHVYYFAPTRAEAISQWNKWNGG